MSIFVCTSFHDRTRPLLTNSGLVQDPIWRMETQLHHLIWWWTPVVSWKNRISSGCTGKEQHISLRWKDCLKWNIIIPLMFSIRWLLIYNKQTLVFLIVEVDDEPSIFNWLILVARFPNSRLNDLEAILLGLRTNSIAWISLKLGVRIDLLSLWIPT